MKAKTELLLYRLHWLAEKPFMPTFYNLTEGFEAWAYKSGFLPQIHRLEAQGLLEAMVDPESGKRLHRLTQAGRSVALGDRDPVAAWARTWDQKWRLFMFDIPEHDRSSRRKLTRALAAAGCGCLQGSVWISPMTSPALEQLLAEEDTDCSHLVMLLADSKGLRVDQRMVEAAWDFEQINERYQNVMAVLDRFRSLGKQCSRGQLDEWTREEKVAWKNALATDPLLPSELLPKGYLGGKAWKQRDDTLPKAARFARGFNESCSVVAPALTIDSTNNPCRGRDKDCW